MKHLLILLLCACAHLTYAQNGTLTWGQGKISGLTPIQFLGYDSKSNAVFLGLQEKGGALLGGGATQLAYVLMVYNRDLKYQDYFPTQIPDLKLDGEEYISLKYVRNIIAVHLADTAYIIGTLPNKDDHHVYAWRIDLDKRKLRREQLIGQMKDVRKFPNDFSWTVSPDKRTGLLSMDLGGQNQESQAFYALVLGSGLTKQNQIQTALPFARKEFAMGAFAVDDLGSITLSGQKRVDRSERIERGLKYEPVLLSYGKDGKSIERNLQFGSKYVQSIKTAFNSDGKGVAVGFYGNDTYYEQDGLFFATLDDNGEISQPIAHEFDADFLVSTLKAKDAQKIKRKLESGERDGSEVSFQMRDLFKMSDGSFMAVAEQYATYTVVTNNAMVNGGLNIPGPMQFEYRYVYGDLMVARFNQSGSMVWVKKIERNESVNTESVYFPRKFMTILKQDRLYLFYEDLVRNKRKDIADILCTVHPDGTITESKIGENKSAGIIAFGMERQALDGELMIMRVRGLGGRKKYVGRLRVQ